MSGGSWGTSSPASLHFDLNVTQEPQLCPQGTLSPPRHRPAHVTGTCVSHASTAGGQSSFSVQWVPTNTAEGHLPAALSRHCGRLVPDQLHLSPSGRGGRQPVHRRPCDPAQSRPFLPSSVCRPSARGWKGGGACALSRGRGGCVGGAAGEGRGDSQCSKPVRGAHTGVPRIWTEHLLGVSDRAVTGRGGARFPPTGLWAPT